MNEANAQPASQEAFEHIEQVGTVELDRYCGNCGYNLRQQAIRREPATRLLLCKCPECGTFEPANSHTTATNSWFRGLVAFIWLFWFAIWLSLVGWSVGGITGLAVVSGDIRRGWMEVEEVDTSRIFDNDGYQNYLTNQANQLNGGAYQNSYFSNNAWDLRPIQNEDIFLIAFFIVLSATIGAVMTTITMIAMPHWRRWGYVCFAVGWPMIGILIFHGLIWRELYSWRIVTVDLTQWHMTSALSIEAAALGASLIAVWLGRPAARGVIRFIVPPKRRGVFAYLWLADGKSPPKTVKA